MKRGKNHTTWHIGVYIRLSKDDGNDESLSVTNQKKITTEYIEKTFAGSEYAIVDYYTDDGISGTSLNRPEFQRMVHDMESHQINCIVTKTLSRAFRNYSDNGYYLEQVFPSYGLRFISISGPELDTHLNPNAVLDGFEVPITAVMNDRYAARTSQDIRRTFDMKRRKGEFIGAFAPYGYKKNPENKNHFVIDDEAAEVVRNIFNWYVHEGMSISGIVKHLNDLGIASPLMYKKSKGLNLHNPNIKLCDGNWGYQTVANLLSNQQYIGNMVQGRNEIISYKVKKMIRKDEVDWYVVEDTHEAIVDKTLFDRAQEKRQLNTRNPKGEKKLYLFSGFLRCPDCGKSMTITNSNRRNKAGEKIGYDYYVCTTYAKQNKKACTRHAIRLDTLTENVLDAIKYHIGTVECLSDSIKQINQKKVIHNESSQLMQRLSDKKNEIAQATHAADSLYDDWKADILTKADYVRMKVNYDEKIKKMKETQTHIEREIKALAKGIGEDNPYLVTFLKYKNVRTLERSLLMELIDTIYVYEKGNNNAQQIQIRFRFSDEHQRIEEFIDNNLSDLKT